jgi:hypothetical protein
MVTGMCPKGDDPITSFTDFRTITIVTSALFGVLGGNFKFTFAGQSFSFPAKASFWLSDACEASFESLPNVESVKCVKDAIDDGFGGSTYTVQFLSFSTQPYENNIFSFDGNPLLSNFSCDTSEATPGINGTCIITDSSVDIVPGIERFCLRFIESVMTMLMVDNLVGSTHRILFMRGCNSFQLPLF